MRTPPKTDPGPALVIAAQRGDRSALDGLAAAYLPLVYNIVGRAMNGHPDTDDVVQETMLRAIRSLGDLRDPEAFRSWLVAIAIRQLRDAHRDRLGQPPAVDSDAPSPDFAELTIARLGLSGQRRETAAATRWLDEEDQPLLALWWQEAAGQLSRAELAASLGLPVAHAAVRIARMKERLATSRTVVRALGRIPSCDRLAAIAAGWDGEPSPLWRKRLGRHVRDCSGCRADAADMVPAERLLSGLPLLAVPAWIAGRTLSRIAASGSGSIAGSGSGSIAGSGSGAGSARHARRGPLFGKGAVSLRPKLFAASLAVLTCAAGGTFAVASAHHTAAPAALNLVIPPSVVIAASSPSAAAATPTPRATGTADKKAASAKTASKPASRPVTKPASTPASTQPPASAPPSASAPPPAAATSERKGVSAVNFSGVTQALTQSGASWYYNWATTPNGIAAPANVSYVPMIWGAADVTTANLDEVSKEGDILLGFNEPDNSSQSNMTVAQALSLWPRLMATGMTLGSPAVASGAATPGGWLDQFMAGAKADGYRVNFIAVHWYGGDFQTAAAVQQLESYLEAIWARYHLPIWLTEFALTNFSGSTPVYPTDAQQAAFLTAATAMLDTLSYVQRYAWFSLPTSSGSGTTGLFNPGPSVTPVGQAFEAAH
jgi:RNA polymerase sigma factor (sigma-70 family)